MEFQYQHHTTKIVVEITAKFRERTLMVPQYASDEVMKKTWYHDMPREDIKEFVSFQLVRHWRT